MKHNLLFGIAYTLTFVPLSLIPINPEVTGPTIFFSPVITWPLVLVALFFSKRLQSLLNRVFFVVLLMTHYLVTVLIVIDAWPDQYPRIERMIGFGESPLMYFIIAWYVAGQLLICSSTYRSGLFAKRTDLP